MVSKGRLVYADADIEFNYAYKMQWLHNSLVERRNNL